MASHSKITILDTPTVFQANTNSSTYSFSYSLPAGSQNRVTVMYFSERDNTISATRAPAIFFNGHAVNSDHGAGNSENNDAADDPGVSFQWYASGALAAGSYTVEIDYAAALIAVTAVVFTIDNVDTTFAPSLGTGYTANNGGGVTSVNNSITTTVDRSIAIQCLTLQAADGTVTPTGSQTTLYSDSGNNGAGPTTYFGYIVTDPAGSTSFPVTFANDDYAELLVYFQPIRRRSHVT